MQDAEQKKYVEIIKQNGEQLTSLVSDLQTISNLHSQQVKITKKTIDPADIIENLYALYEQKANKAGITLKTNIPTNHTTICSDKTKLIQILTNLLSNALKFTREGYVEFGFQLENSSITFYVRDSGIGITKEQQQLIFERFMQADDSIRGKYGGTGLGLSISKGLVELLGGQMKVQSKPGKGSEFSFSLPAPKKSNF
jgi:signal transduction histidine kinase